MLYRKWCFQRFTQKTYILIGFLYFFIHNSITLTFYNIGEIYLCFTKTYV